MTSGMIPNISRERPIQHRQVDSPEVSPRVSVSHSLRHGIESIESPLGWQ